jgi:LPXTG-motif cell wall-anchored protein
VGAGAPPLANTGVKTGELAALGLLLLAVGAGLTVTGRRRRA